MEEKKELMEFEKVLDFEKILNAIAQKGDGSHHVKLPNKFSPTELSGCMRCAYYNRQAPEKFTDGSYINFLYGNIMHELFQDSLEMKTKNKKLEEMFKDKISYIENEKAFHYLIPLEKTGGKRIVISGRLDTIVYFKDDPTPVVIDYKTTRAIKYNVHSPKQAHVAQLNYYLGCVLADYGILVYINKPDMRIVQHTVPWSQTVFDVMVDFAVDLNTAIETNVAPIVNKPEMKDGGYCAYCRHKMKCSAYEKELKER